MSDPLTDKVGPVNHIVRAALPWRSAADLTECGRPVGDVAGRLLTRDEASSRIRRIGKKRAVFELCMTCVETSDRHQDDAVAVVAREVGAAQYATPPSPYTPLHDDPRSAKRQQRWADQWAERQRLDSEFEAIAALIAAHHDEFDGFLTGKAETVSLDDRRRQRRREGR